MARTHHISTHRISTRALFALSLVVLACLIILTPSPARSANTSVAGPRGAVHQTRALHTTSGSHTVKLLVGFHGR